MTSSVLPPMSSTIQKSIVNVGEVINEIRWTNGFHARIYLVWWVIHFPSLYMILIFSPCILCASDTGTYSLVIVLTSYTGSRNIHYRIHWELSEDWAYTNPSMWHQGTVCVTIWSVKLCTMKSGLAGISNGHHSARQQDALDDVGKCKFFYLDYQVSLFFSHKSLLKSLRIFDCDTEDETDDSPIFLP